MPLPPPAPDAHVLVTGASSGIGAEIARALARRGYPTVLVARRAEALADLAAELSDPGAEVHAADLGDDADRERIRDVIQGDERIVGVVNAAGYGVTGKVADLAAEPERAEALDGLVRLDVLALHDLSVAAVGALTRRAKSTRRTGAILNVSSVAAYQPMPGGASYAASKAFVQSFSEAVHAELAGTGVTVTSLSPGLTKTEFDTRAGVDGVFDRAPDLLVDTAANVAEAGVAAMAAGRRTVVPGVLNQLQAASGRVVPRTLLLPAINAAAGRWFD